MLRSCSTDELLSEVVITEVLVAKARIYSSLDSFILYLNKSDVRSGLKIASFQVLSQINSCLLPVLFLFRVVNNRDCAVVVGYSDLLHGFLEQRGVVVFPLGPEFVQHCFLFQFLRFFFPIPR